MSYNYSDSEPSWASNPEDYGEDSIGKAETGAQFNDGDVGTSDDLVHYLPEPDDSIFSNDFDRSCPNIHDSDQFDSQNESNLSLDTSSRETTTNPTQFSTFQQKRRASGYVNNDGVFYGASSFAEAHNGPKPLSLSEDDTFDDTIDALSSTSPIHQKNKHQNNYHTQPEPSPNNFSILNESEDNIVAVKKIIFSDSEDDQNISMLSQQSDLDNSNSIEHEHTSAISSATSKTSPSSTSMHPALGTMSSKSHIQPSTPLSRGSTLATFRRHEEFLTLDSDSSVASEVCSVSRNAYHFGKTEEEIADETSSPSSWDLKDRLRLLKRFTNARKILCLQSAVYDHHHKHARPLPGETALDLQDPDVNHCTIDELLSLLYYTEYLEAIAQQNLQFAHILDKQSLGIFDSDDLQYCENIIDLIPFEAPSSPLKRIRKKSQRLLPDCDEAFPQKAIRRVQFGDNYDRSNDPEPETGVDPNNPLSPRVLQRGLTTEQIIQRAKEVSQQRLEQEEEDSIYGHILDLSSSTDIDLSMSLTSPRSSYASYSSSMSMLSPKSTTNGFQRNFPLSGVQGKHGPFSPFSSPPKSRAFPSLSGAVGLSTPLKDLQEEAESCQSSNSHSHSASALTSTLPGSTLQPIPFAEDSEDGMSASVPTSSTHTNTNDRRTTTAPPITPLSPVPTMKHPPSLFARPSAHALGSSGFFAKNAKSGPAMTVPTIPRLSMLSPAKPTFQPLRVSSPTSPQSPQSTALDATNETEDIPSKQPILDNTTTLPLTSDLLQEATQEMMENQPLVNSSEDDSLSGQTIPEVMSEPSLCDEVATNELRSEISDPSTSPHHKQPETQPATTLASAPISSGIRLTVQSFAGSEDCEGSGSHVIDESSADGFGDVFSGQLHLPTISLNDFSCTEPVTEKADDYTTDHDPDSDPNMKSVTLERPKSRATTTRPTTSSQNVASFAATNTGQSTSSTRSSGTHPSHSSMNRVSATGFRPNHTGPVSSLSGLSSFQHTAKTPERVRVKPNLSQNATTGSQNSIYAGRTPKKAPGPSMMSKTPDTALRRPTDIRAVPNPVMSSSMVRGRARERDSRLSSSTSSGLVTAAHEPSSKGSRPFTSCSSRTMTPGPRVSTYSSQSQSQSALNRPPTQLSLTQTDLTETIRKLPRCPGVALPKVTHHMNQATIDKAIHEYLLRIERQQARMKLEQRAHNYAKNYASSQLEAGNSKTKPSTNSKSTLGHTNQMNSSLPRSTMSTSASASASTSTSTSTINQTSTPGRNRKSTMQPKP